MTILSMFKIRIKSFQIPKSFKKSLELALTANVRLSFEIVCFFQLLKLGIFFSRAIAANDPTKPENNQKIIFKYFIFHLETFTLTINEQ